MTDRQLYVRADGGARSHILHVVTQESWPTGNQRIFRDHLGTHPEDARCYAQLKWATAAASTGAGEYSRGKTAPAQEITDRARAALGLPSVPVWEKG
ncbi:hypothetical protein DEJ48_34535 [Streptomyces venezuelae]|uniref:Uncharacterized protein n=1 Tax=Streptomyces venezuelae TaxID=54571 RepID=A0A5P2C511_STRVZ|nr:hypothetical protein DEJ48_34535 [Streptomyces venezuelae]